MPENSGLQTLLQTKQVKEPELSSKAYYVQQETPPDMLKVICANGELHAFGYPYLVRLLFYEENKLTIAFTEGVVYLTGTNLIPLFDALLQHTVAWIQQEQQQQEQGKEEQQALDQTKVIETDQAKAKIDITKTVITDIQVQ